MMDGTCKQVLNKHLGAVVNASFSPDGSRIITATGAASSESPGVKFPPRCDIEASTDCTARVWDPTFGDCLLTLQGHGADTWGKNSCI